MTVQNPPVFIQAGSHPAEDVRRMFYAQMGGREGVVKGLTVTEKSGTANMSVDVAEGSAFIGGTESTYQGLYFVENRGTTNLVVSASDPTNDRYDLVVAKVQDSAESGATDAWSLAIVTGTAAATPLFPTVPANAIVLATILVQNAVATIVNADITSIIDGSDTDGTTTLINRGYAVARGGVVPCTSSTRPTSGLYEGMKIYETDTDKEKVYNGSTWVTTYELYTAKNAKVKLATSTTQSIANATFTKVTLDTSVRTPSGWTFSSSQITPNSEAGLYLATGQVCWASNATGIRILQFYYNAGAEIEGLSHLVQDVSGHGNDWVQSITGVFYLDGASALSLYCYQSSGGALDIKATASDYVHLTLTRIG